MSFPSPSSSSSNKNNNSISPYSDSPSIQQQLIQCTLNKFSILIQFVSKIWKQTPDIDLDILLISSNVKSQQKLYHIESHPVIQSETTLLYSFPIQPISIFPNDRLVFTAKKKNSLFSKRQSFHLEINWGHFVDSQQNSFLQLLFDNDQDIANNDHSQSDDDEQAPFQLKIEFEKTWKTTFGSNSSDPLSSLRSQYAYLLAKADKYCSIDQDLKTTPVTPFHYPTLWQLAKCTICQGSPVVFSGPCAYIDSKYRLVTQPSERNYPATFATSCTFPGCLSEFSLFSSVLVCYMCGFPFCPHHIKDVDYGNKLVRKTCHACHPSILPTIIPHSKSSPQLESISEPFHFFHSNKDFYLYFAGKTIYGVVRWIPDSTIVNCQYCNDPFSLFNRRHHCRSCGFIFCSDCSNHKWDIRGYNFPQRVCDECASMLNLQQKQQRREDRILNRSLSNSSFNSSPTGKSSPITHGSSRGSKQSTPTPTSPTLLKDNGFESTALARSTKSLYFPSSPNSHFQKNGTPSPVSSPVSPNSQNSQNSQK